MRPEQNVWNFVEDILKGIFLKDKFCILIQISLKLIFKDSVDNNWVSSQAMVWRWRDVKPLPEPVINLFTDTYMEPQASLS